MTLKPSCRCTLTSSLQVRNYNNNNKSDKQQYLLHCICVSLVTVFSCMNALFKLSCIRASADAAFAYLSITDNVIDNC